MHPGPPDPTRKPESTPQMLRTGLWGSRPVDLQAPPFPCAPSAPPAAPIEQQTAQPFRHTENIAVVWGFAVVCLCSRPTDQPQDRDQPRKRDQRD